MANTIKWLNMDLRCLIAWPDGTCEYTKPEYCDFETILSLKQKGMLKDDPTLELFEFSWAEDDGLFEAIHDNFLAEKWKSWDDVPSHAYEQTGTY